MRPVSDFDASLREGNSLASLSEWVYSRVARRDFEAPGFALVRFEKPVVGESLRAEMEELRDHLDDISRRQEGRRLTQLSFVQFDQQRSTKFHLDGGPRESILMLGYEPSAVASQLFLADYSQAAAEKGLAPDEFLAAHNPMFVPGEAALARHITELTTFDPAQTCVVLINNSSAHLGQGLQGVMHKAIVGRPMPDRERIVHSMMLCVGC